MDGLTGGILVKHRICNPLGVPGPCWEISHTRNGLAFHVNPGERHKYGTSSGPIRPITRRPLLGWRVISGVDASELGVSGHDDLAGMGGMGDDARMHLLMLQQAGPVHHMDLQDIRMVATNCSFLLTYDFATTVVVAGATICAETVPLPS